MAANALQIMEAANLFAGTVDPTASNHMTLSELKLPTMETAFVDFNPAGAPVAIEVQTHINKLEATFNLAGFSPQVMALFYKWAANEQHFTAYGLVRDRMNGAALQAKAIMWGQLGRVAPTNFRRGDLHQHEYSIKGITHYELYIGETTIYNWDFFTQTLNIGGADALLEFNTALNVPIQPLTQPVVPNLNVPLTQGNA